MKQQYDRGTMTHLILNKMSGISQTICLDAFSWMKNFVFLIKISLKFVPKGPNDINPALVTNADPIHWRIYAAQGGDEF